MHLSLEELATLTGGKLIHPGSDSNSRPGITGVSSLDEASSGDVSFLGNEKYYQDYLQTKASVVLVPDIVPKEPSPDDSVALIEVENPSLAFGRVVKHFTSQQQKFTPGIHPRAVVADDVALDPTKVCVKAGAVIESGSSIGNGTEIGPNVVIGANVSIGEDCIFYANVTVHQGCIIRDRVILKSGAVIGSEGFGFELTDGKHLKIDQVGIALLENDVEIGANSTVDRARFGKTVVGEGSKVDNQVQIGHNVRIGKHCLLVAQCGVAGSTHLGDYVTMAAKSGCTGHIKLHDHVVLTARATALKDLKGGVVYKGMPARPIMEEQKKLAALARLPKLMKEVKELRRRLDEAQID